MHALFDRESQNKSLKIYVFVGDREDAPGLTFPHSKSSHFSQVNASKVLKYRAGLNEVVLKIDGHEPVRVDLTALRPDTAHKVWLDFVHTKD